MYKWAHCCSADFARGLEGLSWELHEPSGCDQGTLSLKEILILQLAGWSMMKVFQIYPMVSVQASIYFCIYVVSPEFVSEFIISSTGKAC